MPSRSLIINEKSVKLQLWDTAGQERFKGLANSYFKGAHAVLLVYDVRNKESFKDLKNYWFKEVNQPLI
jgi:GTPase SAR1 family protein